MDGYGREWELDCLASDALGLLCEILMSPELRFLDEPGPYLERYNQLSVRYEALNQDVMNQYTASELSEINAILEASFEEENREEV
jgi:hypothetical protein